MTKQYEMQIGGGLAAAFHLPPASKSDRDRDGNEIEQRLPPAARQPVYRVEDYAACPTDWMHGSKDAASYFVRVEPEKGMWLDFNRCCYDTHDVAVVVSVQGLNPLTGRKADAMRLEQYKGKCPVHDADLQQDRLCSKCGFKWPPQNYLATTGTPYGQFWLDGFRAADGVVRQWVFTEDELKGVAAKKLGKDRVFAIGIAFYRSRKPKPSPWTELSKRSYTFGSQNDKLVHPLAETPSHWVVQADSPTVYEYTTSIGSPKVTCSTSDYRPISASAAGAEVQTGGGILRGYNERATKSGLRSFRKSSAHVDAVTPVKTLEVKAGARIRQHVYADPRDLSCWEEQPVGMLYVNYADPETFDRIMRSGRRAEADEGFLADVPVGQ